MEKISNKKHFLQMGRQDLLNEIHDRQKNIVLLNSQIYDLTIEKDLENIDSE